MFKVGDIVEYIGMNKDWRKARFKFSVQYVDKYTVQVINLQYIQKEYPKGHILCFAPNLLIKCVDKKNHLPKWF